MTKLLTTVVVLQAAILYTLWTGPSGFVAPARAQIPDAGAQQQQIIDELKAVNARLDRLTATLESGHLKVTVTPAAGENAPAASSPRQQGGRGGR